MIFIITNYLIDFGLNPEHILEYWKRAERNWPTLASIARDYLAIPAASVGVERLFNQARDICSYRRHHL
jgi:hAT family C-terminal dimerisation region